MIGDKNQTPVVQVYDEMNALKDRLARWMADIEGRLGTLEKRFELHQALSGTENPPSANG